MIVHDFYRSAFPPVTDAAETKERTMSRNGIRRRELRCETQRRL